MHVRIERIQAIDFLGLAKLDLDLPDDYTTLTGPNGVGKTTVLTACAVARATVDDIRWQVEQYEWMSSGHRGSDSFELRLTIAFDEPSEQDVIDAFYRAACLRLLHLENAKGNQIADAALERWGLRPAEAMYRGDLVVNFDASLREKWRAGWEFDLAAGRATATLLGSRISGLRSGPLAGYGKVTWLPELVTSTNNIAEMLSAGQVPLTLEETLQDQGFDFVVEPSNLPHEPSDISYIRDLFPRPPSERVGFRDVLNRLFTEQLVITPNRRFAANTLFKVDDLRGPLDLSDGTNVAVELFRLKNGSANEVARFALAQDIFEQLTGKEFDVTQTVVDVNGDEQPSLRIRPVQRGGAGSFAPDIPISRLGAGAEEALFCAAVLSGPGRVLMIDEPGVHTSPTAMSRLRSALHRHADRGQVVVITHSPDLVPSTRLSDLGKVVRLTNQPASVEAHRIPPDVLTGSGMLRHLGSPTIRSLLFASGVLLCEGDSDVALLQTWIEQGLGGGLPTSTEANVSIIAVGGDNDFVHAIRFAEGFRIPWSAVTDGPALAPTSHLWKFFTSRGWLPDPSTLTSADFVTVAGLWGTNRVHTLATTYGTGQDKGAGEIEAFMERVDSRALAAARQKAKRRKGLALSALFANAVPPPQEVRDLWAAVLTDLGLDTTI